MENENEKSPVMCRGIDRAKVISVIRTEALAGAGTTKDPFYIKVQYWTLEGQLIGERAKMSASDV